MLQKILEQLVPVLLEIFIAVILPALFIKVSRYLKTKEVELQSKIGKREYDYLLETTKRIFFIVEEKFRKVEGSSDTKKSEFDNMMRLLYPNMQQEELDHLRQAIVGEYNKTIRPLIEKTEDSPQLPSMYQTIQPITSPQEYLYNTPPNCTRSDIQPQVTEELK